MQLQVIDHSIRSALACLLIASLLLAACSSSSSPTPTAAPAAAPTSTVAPAAILNPTADVSIPSPAMEVATPSPTAEIAKPTATEEIAPLTTEITTYIHYADVDEVGFVLDVYAPRNPGPWPVVVVAHGGGERRSSLAPLSAAIASQGAVVYNIDVLFTFPWSTGIESIACAVRFARATAADYGGDPGRITLVGNSAGAATGIVVALAGDDFMGDCVVTDASALPDAFVAYEGPYNYTTTFYPAPHPDHTFLKDEDPELWEAINPFSHIGRNPDLQVRLIHGDDVDFAWYETLPQVSIDFHQTLADAGYDVELIFVEGAAHTALTTSSSEAFALTIQQVMELEHISSQ